MNLMRQISAGMKLSCLICSFAQEKNHSQRGRRRRVGDPEYSVAVTRGIPKLPKSGKLASWAELVPQ